MKLNKINFFTLSLCLSCCLAHAEDPKTPPAKAPAAAELKTNDTSVAALLDGKSITVGDIDGEIKRKPQLSMRFNMTKGDQLAVEQLRKAALEGMIGRRLLLEAAQKSKNIDEPEVQKSVDEVITQYGGAEKLAGLLGGIGTDLPQFKAEIANDFRIRSYIEKNLSKDIKIEADEAKKMFDANPSSFAQPELVHARHILVKLENGSTDAQSAEAKTKIDDLYKKVTEPNADFSKVALENSDCPSKTQGGDLGFFARGSMVPEFEEIAFGLKPGEISKPLKTRFGYHIIKLEEHKDAQKPDFEKVKSRLEDQIRQVKASEVVQTKIIALKKAAKIEYKLAYLKEQAIAPGVQNPHAPHGAVIPPAPGAAPKEGKKS